MIAFVAVTADAQMKTQVKNPAPTPAPAATSNTARPMPVHKPTPDAAKRVSQEEAFRLYQAGTAVFVDVRSREQYDLGHIKGAFSIPGSQIIKRLREVPPNKTIITYCACSAEQSSGRAVVELNAHGVKKTMALVGGWQEWQKAGRPTEKTN